MKNRLTCKTFYHEIDTRSEIVTRLANFVEHRVLVRTHIQSSYFLEFGQ